MKYYYDPSGAIVGKPLSFLKKGNGLGQIK